MMYWTCDQFTVSENDYVWMENREKSLFEQQTKYQNADMDNTFWPSILLKVESSRMAFYKNSRLMCFIPLMYKPINEKLDLV